MHVCTYACTETPRDSCRCWPHFTDRKTEARDELSNVPMVAAWVLWGSGCWARVGTLPVKGQRAGVLALGASLRHGDVATPHVNGETRIQPPASARGLSTDGKRCCAGAHQPCLWLPGPLRSCGNPARHKARRPEHIQSHSPPTPLEARGPVTLVGEPRIGGKGFRCRKSGSLGEPRRGRQDCSPWEGCGGLACGWPNATPSGSVGGLGSLGRTTRRSDRFGALCRRQPSPALWGECSGAEEPREGQDGPNHSCPEDCLDLPTRPTRTVYRDPHACSGFPTLHCAPEETGTEELRHLREVTQHGRVGVGSEPHSGPP